MPFWGLPSSLLVPGAGQYQLPGPPQDIAPHTSGPAPAPGHPPGPHSQHPLDPAPTPVGQYQSQPLPQVLQVASQAPTLPMSRPALALSPHRPCRQLPQNLDPHTSRPAPDPRPHEYYSQHPHGPASQLVVRYQTQDPPSHRASRPRTWSCLPEGWHQP